MRRGIIIGAAAAALMLIAGPALADGQSGSTEHHEDCVTDPDTGEETCTTVYDNDVTCGEGQATVPAPTGELIIGGTGDPAAPAGELEVCSADSPVLEGRVIAGGSSDGGYIIADGDKDNEANAEQAGGYARVDVDGSGPTVTCGADGGHMDGTEPDTGDSQEACG